MEQDENLKDSSRTHHGHAIKRLREYRKLSQQKLGQLVNMVQQNISVYESKKVIDDSILDIFAAALNVDVNMIKSMEDYDSDFYYNIVSNTVSGNMGEATFGSNERVNEGTINYYYNADKTLHDKIINHEERIKRIEEELKKLKNDGNSTL